MVVSNFVLRGASVVDGTGSPARRADVAVSGGRITEVGEVARDIDADEVDLSGLVLAPGVVDIHTHYDAQVLWDPDLTPSSWHGVTTVVIGNCGFGLAPLRPEQRHTMARTLENVEAMSYEALEAGISWGFETFPEYLDALDRLAPRLNVGALLGHTPLRMYVLGDDTERPATDGEVAEMCRLLREAMGAGALGFATSRSPNHQGEDGRPVPSRSAEFAEILALAESVAQSGRGIIQTAYPGISWGEYATILERTNLPITYTGIAAAAYPKDKGRAAHHLGRVKALGDRAWPQFQIRPIVFQANMMDPAVLSYLPTFQEILALPRDDRASLYSDPAWRDRARVEVDKAWEGRWQKISVQETERHLDLLGVPLGTVAVSRGVEPFDAMIDLSLEEGLKTRFRCVLANDDDQEMIDLLTDPFVLLGGHDGGAHASQMCDCCFPTYMLDYWVKERQVLTMEEAVWKMTLQPAEVFGISGRGSVRPGYAADLMAFDAGSVAAQQLQRVADLPAGADRLIAGSTGVEHVWVNGEAIRLHGKDVDFSDPSSRPGKVIRPS